MKCQMTATYINYIKITWMNNNNNNNTNTYVSNSLIFFSIILY